jgi:hypothetical protein
MGNLFSSSPKSSEITYNYPVLADNSTICIDNINNIFNETTINYLAYILPIIIFIFSEKLKLIYIIHLFKKSYESGKYEQSELEKIINNNNMVIHFTGLDDIKEMIKKFGITTPEININNNSMVLLDIYDFFEKVIKFKEQSNETKSINNPINIQLLETFLYFSIIYISYYILQLIKKNTTIETNLYNSILEWINAMYPEIVNKRPLVQFIETISQHIIDKIKLITDTNVWGNWAVNKSLEIAVGKQMAIKIHEYITIIVNVFTKCGFNLYNLLIKILNNYEMSANETTQTTDKENIQEFNIEFNSIITYLLNQIVIFGQTCIKYTSYYLSILYNEKNELTKDDSKDDSIDITKIINKEYGDLVYIANIITYLFGIKYLIQILINKSIVLSVLGAIGTNANLLFNNNSADKSIWKKIQEFINGPNDETINLRPIIKYLEEKQKTDKLTNILDILQHKPLDIKLIKKTLSIDDSDSDTIITNTMTPLHEELTKDINNQQSEQIISLSAFKSFFRAEIRDLTIDDAIKGFLIAQIDITILINNNIINDDYVIQNKLESYELFLKKYEINPEITKILKDKHIKGILTKINFDSATSNKYYKYYIKYNNLKKKIIKYNTIE